jgi:hypothetical protein
VQEATEEEEVEVVVVEVVEEIWYQVKSVV